MAKFEGIKWASHQMRYLLPSKQFDLLESDSKVFAVSRSIHYGIFLAFEGIRFFCKKNREGSLEVTFLNWNKNLERFRRGISFNLGSDQQNWVPDVEEMENIFIQQYFHHSSMRDFFNEMADLGAQGYLRPFTVDEEQSIGVTFPGQPSVRAVVCRYDRYLGEPFTGVVVPGMVRAVGANQTGCLKLGVNYLMSCKAIDAVKKIHPQAASALFLDDQTHLPLEKRRITEWDSSCCLFAFADGSVVKIPESNLILPSVTIQGIVSILKEMGIPVEERDISYGELIQKEKDEELVAVCSVGTAGILNRCQNLLMVDEEGKTLAKHKVNQEHELYHKLGQAKKHYWEIYQEKIKLPADLKLSKYTL
ncbi:aminotransferase class IV [bacterium]|nr:aminotransferase class IV [bacterium]